MPYYYEDYCDTCEREFNTREDLHKHWIYSNSHAWCQRHDTHFKNRAALISHLRASSSHWGCIECQVDYETEAELDEHYMNSPRHHRCDKCYLEFDTESNLQSHSRIHLPRDIACFGCGDRQMFATHSAMLIHLESNNCSTTMEDLDFFAQKCFQSKKYVVKGLRDFLRERRRSEERAGGRYMEYMRNWVCNNRDCQGVFDTEARMRQHVNSPVHDCCPYKCPGCDVRFSVISGLLQHVESNACDEGIYQGSGIIGKLLHFLLISV